MYVVLFPINTVRYDQLATIDSQHRRFLRWETSPDLYFILVVHIWDLFFIIGARMFIGNGWAISSHNT